MIPLDELSRRVEEARWTTDHSGGGEEVMKLYGRVESERSATDALIEAMEKRVEKMREALKRIRECVGGDNPSGGMNAPEDVWGIAESALQEPNK